ncbi:MAG: cupin domain-containing protein [Tumebacillaceae bacterium]
MSKYPVLNVNNIPSEFEDQEFLAGCRTQFLGQAAGSEKLYVNIDFLQPGAQSAKYHTHSLQEEFFLILSGTGTLRINDEEIPVKQGDFVAKPAGKGIAHHFINTGTEIMQILDCGTIDRNDVATYPDEDVVFLRKDGLYFKKSDSLKDWTSIPEE